MTTRIDPASASATSERAETPDPGRRRPSFAEVGEGPDRRAIAHILDRRGDTALLWLGGYGSDMRGSKAECLAAFAAQSGLTFCRFDYSGHGESSGDFGDGTITRWTNDAEAIADRVPGSRLVLAGSSMGAWIALRLIDRLRRSGRGDRLAGLLLLAPAPDFTTRLLAPRLSAEQRRDLREKGFCTEPSPYGPEPTIYTQALFDDGARNLVMDGLIETGCPIHIVQGMMDADVPYHHALDLVAALPADGVVLTLVRDGDHRLSRPDDLRRMTEAVRGLAQGG